MGLLPQSVGELAEARTYLQQALEMRRQDLGEDHSDTAQVLLTLGQLFLQEGRLDEAVAYTERALAVYRRIQDEDDSYLKTAGAANNLGAFLNGLGKNKQALAYLEEALRAYRH